MSTRGSTALAFAAISIALAFAQQQYSADTSGAASDDDVGGLEVNIPGIPGEDYPIYANVPDTGFTCDGLVEGGYYADPSAECQVEIKQKDFRKVDNFVSAGLPYLCQ